MICPACGKQVDAASATCPFCGQALPASAGAPAPKHAQHFRDPNATVAAPADPDATVAAPADPDATVFAAPPTTVLGGDETQLVNPAARTTVVPPASTTVIPSNAVESSPYDDPDANGTNGKPPREPWPTWQKVLLGVVIVAVVALVVVLATKLLPKGPDPATPATSEVAATTPATTAATTTAATTAATTTPETTPATTPATTQDTRGTGHELTTGANGLQTYYNQYYGFSFTLPEEVDPHELYTEGGVETGLSAVNLSTQTCIQVWAEPNNTGTSSPKKLLDDFCDGRTMTYSELGDNWYVASWIDSDDKNIGYRKVYVGSSTLDIIEYSYLKDDAESGDKMVKYSISSFVPGDLDR